MRECGGKMMYGISELQEVYLLWKTKRSSKIEKFSISFKLEESRRPFVFAGISCLRKYLQAPVFRRDDIAYLHSLSLSNGKLLFTDDFIAYLSSLTFDLDLKAPLEGSIFFPGEPIVKVSGSAPLLIFFKKILKHYLPRQIQIATEVERIASLVSPASVIIENNSHSYDTESVLDTRSAYIGGAVAGEDLNAALKYNIPLCYHQEEKGVTVLDTCDVDYIKRLTMVSAEEQVFLKGKITKEMLKELPFYSVNLTGVMIKVNDLLDTRLKIRFHYYRATEVLDENFMVFRFSHKGLYIGDLVTSCREMFIKKVVFGVVSNNIVQKELLVDVSNQKEECLKSIRTRVLASMRRLPCKYQNEDAEKDYPVRIKGNVQDYRLESASNTKLA